MIIPDICIPYARQQRTGFKNVRSGYIKQLMEDYKEIEPYLPEKVDKFADIGCGICGVDILAYENYNCRLYLIDKDESSIRPVYGYNNGKSFYNSFDAAKRMLSDNDIPESAYRFIEAEKGDDIKRAAQMDVIISLYSCGYHYSVELYLDWIKGHLADRGVLILDTREDTQEEEIIRENFTSVYIISRKNKSVRIAAWN